eukprot:c19806_g1_i2.p1 GENE.c19806_g1_i2~~c19806_g1_i2.p1  ORF type:complete len:379 (+),score=59.98 c19806_g1_i2:38-1138(+)
MKSLLVVVALWSSSADAVSITCDAAATCSSLTGAASQIFTFTLATQTTVRFSTCNSPDVSSSSLKIQSSSSTLLDCDVNVCPNCGGNKQNLVDQTLNDLPTGTYTVSLHQPVGFESGTQQLCLAIFCVATPTSTPSLSSTISRSSSQTASGTETPSRTPSTTITSSKTESKSNSESVTRSRTTSRSSSSSPSSSRSRTASASSTATTSQTSSKTATTSGSSSPSSAPSPLPIKEGASTTIISAAAGGAAGAAFVIGVAMFFKPAKTLVIKEREEVDVTINPMIFAHEAHLEKRLATAEENTIGQQRTDDDWNPSNHADTMSEGTIQSTIELGLMRKQSSERRRQKANELRQNKDEDSLSSSDEEKH